MLFYENTKPIDLKLTFQQNLEKSDITELTVQYNQKSMTICSKSEEKFVINGNTSTCTVLSSFLQNVEYSLYFTNKCLENTKLATFIAQDPSLMKGHFKVGYIKKVQIASNNAFTIEFYQNGEPRFQFQQHQEL